MEPGPMLVCDGVDRPVVLIPADGGMTCVFVFDDEGEAVRFRAWRKGSRPRFPDAGVECARGHSASEAVLASSVSGHSQADSLQILGWSPDGNGFTAWEAARCAYHGSRSGGELGRFSLGDADRDRGAG
jgi:hypothetical protein